MAVKTLQTHSCKQELQNVSLKATPARLAVLKHMEQERKPLDVSSLVSYLRKRSMKTSPVTVFRMMNTFVNRGLARQVRFTEGKTRYEYSSLPEHHHLFCEKCGSVQDIEGCAVEELERRVCQTNGFATKGHFLELIGICKTCQN